LLVEPRRMECFRRYRTGTQSDNPVFLKGRERIIAPPPRPHDHVAVAFAGASQRNLNESATWCCARSPAPSKGLAERRVGHGEGEREGDDASHRSAGGVATLVLEPLPERAKSVALRCPCEAAAPCQTVAIQQAVGKNTHIQPRDRGPINTVNGKEPATGGAAHVFQQNARVHGVRGTDWWEFLGIRARRVRRIVAAERRLRSISAGPEH
jgi:hypothetical protein